MNINKLIEGQRETYPEKTAEQKQIDLECGCECHKKQGTTQNYMWCGNCGDKHQEDSRIKKQLE